MDLTTIAIQTAIVIGLIEVIKRSFLQECHYRLIPAIALVIGAIVCLLLFPAPTVRQSVIEGLIVGLTSVGLFSTGKNTVDIIQNK